MFVCSITEQRTTLICPKDVKKNLKWEILWKPEKDLYVLVSLYSEKERSMVLQKLKSKIFSDLILRAVPSFIQSIHATPS